VYNLHGRLNGKPSAIIALYQLPGSNALDASKGARKFMEDAKRRFPAGLDYAISLDTTLAVSQGLREITKTLWQALLLVILVVFIFLQSWRTSLIPLLAVPVSLVGAFTLFPLVGFSINTLSLFGLVLAIGLVVDDAIVVVEAVERHIEEGMEPRAAALQAMTEVSGPVVAIALILAAVFIPTVFISGITGRLYRQFAVTIAISVIISAFNALSLSPALAALLLRPRRETHGPLSWFFARFNRLFERATHGYVHWSGVLLRKYGVALVLLLAATLVAIALGRRLPQAFLPEEDQGYIYVNVQLPLAASLDRTDEFCNQVEQILRQTPGVQYYTTVVGFSLLSFVQSTYNAFFFVTLKPWDERTRPGEQYQAIQARLNREFAGLPAATAFTFPPPAIPGVGTSGGFTFVLEDRSGAQDPGFLTRNLEAFMAAARRRPEIAMITTTALPSVPQLFIGVDRAKVLSEGVNLTEVYRTMQTFLGGYFVNYFNRFGRQWQVYVEAENQFRAQAENVGLFYVRNSQGQSVPLSTLTRIQPRTGPEFVLHFNEYPSAQINGSAAPGYSSAQVTRVLEEVFAQTMPREMGFNYLGMSFQEQKAAQGISPMMIFGLSLVFVFLILAALYESWSLPFSVLLSTPVAVFGAYLALYARSFQNNVYVQIGLLMLIGLAAKNAILIIEFAKREYEGGRSLTDAALAGARLRLRPILMTSFAFVLGCVPLWLATGSGGVSRETLGTTVIGGMLGATLLGIFIVPVAFFVVERLAAGFGRHRPEPQPREGS
jgi:HAE1 family hydrophobic/amphiphilic exporter-1